MIVAAVITPFEGFMVGIICGAALIAVLILAIAILTDWLE